jgi:demethylmenaquinone methyltransferase/2-methoxy-6-polyprenyl-1,4-benzoquinol methylase
MANGLQKIYKEVPGTYELINHILTFWLDIRWRNKAARLAASKGGKMWMDVCTGTGEMAVSLKELAGDGTMVVGADFSSPMVKMAASKPESDSINFTICDIANLPFEDDTFDLITISFATRNINKNPEFLKACLREFRRVLKPGASFVNLETSQPKSRILRGIFHLYIRLAVKRLGGRISGSRAGYAYLSSTIPRFYGAEEFTGIIKSAGFESVNCRQMLFGAAAIHEGKKGQ